MKNLVVYRRSRKLSKKAWNEKLEWLASGFYGSELISFLADAPTRTHHLTLLRRRKKGLRNGKRLKMELKTSTSRDPCRKEEDMEEISFLTHPSDMNFLVWHSSLLEKAENGRGIELSEIPRRLKCYEHFNWIPWGTLRDSEHFKVELS